MCPKEQDTSRVEREREREREREKGTEMKEGEETFGEIERENKKDNRREGK